MAQGKTAVEKEDATSQTARVSDPNFRTRRLAVDQMAVEATLVKGHHACGTSVPTRVRPQGAYPPASKRPGDSSTTIHRCFSAHFSAPVCRIVTLAPAFSGLCTSNLPGTTTTTVLSTQSSRICRHGSCRFVAGDHMLGRPRKPQTVFLTCVACLSACVQPQRVVSTSRL